jgi:hypothetical protein
MILLFFLFGVIFLIGLGWCNRQPAPRRYPWKTVSFACLGLAGFWFAIYVVVQISSQLAAFVLLGGLIALLFPSLAFALKRSADVPVEIPSDRNIRRGARVISVSDLQSYLNSK